MGNEYVCEYGVDHGIANVYYNLPCNVADNRYLGKCYENCYGSSGTVTRSVYVTDNECHSNTAPTITLVPEAGVLAIPAGVPWDPMGISWIVTPNDFIVDDIPASFAYKFETVLDHNPLSILNAANPTSGLYTVYNIALGHCGGMSAVSRVAVVMVQ